MRVFLIDNDTTRHSRWESEIGQVRPRVALKIEKNADQDQVIRYQADVLAVHLNNPEQGAIEARRWIKLSKELLQKTFFFSGQETDREEAYGYWTYPEAEVQTQIRKLSDEFAAERKQPVPPRTVNLEMPSGNNSVTPANNTQWCAVGDEKGHLRYIETIEVLRGIWQTESANPLEIVIPERSNEAPDWDPRKFLTRLWAWCPEPLCRQVVTVRPAATEGNPDLENALEKFETRGAIRWRITDPRDSPSKIASGSPFSPELHEKLLHEHAAPPGIKGSRHDQANRWGTWLLADGLSRGWNIATDLADELGRELAENDAFYARNIRSCKATPQPGAGSPAVSDWPCPQNAAEMNILVVDDRADEGWARLIEKIACEFHSDAQVTVARSETEAKKVLQEKGAAQKFDLLLLDLRLNPGGDPELLNTRDPEKLSGIRVLKTAKERDFTLPVIVTTASDKAVSARAVSEHGGDGYWMKSSPLSVEPSSADDTASAFVDTLTNVLGWSLQTRPLLERTRKLCTQIETHPNLNRQEPEDKGKVRQSLKSKLRWLEGILHQPESTLVQERLETGQWELAFLAVWAIGTDLLEILWLPPCQKDGPPSSLYGMGENVSVTWTETENQTKTKKVWKFTDTTATSAKNLPKPTADKSKLDAGKMQLALQYLAPDQQDNFDKLRTWRNQNPLVHGKATDVSASTPTPKRGDDEARESIESLLGVFEELSRHNVTPPA